MSFNIYKYIKKYWRRLILIILGIVFFFIYSFLICGNSFSKFTWPDETANYFFVKNYIEYSNFSAREPLNEIAGDIIKPRSFNIYQGNLVPGSFLGMPLIYGIIGKITGINLIKFLTPLLAVLAGLFFYKILLKVFVPKIAFLSSLLFFINPAWWYYASFSMLPNISFLSFLIIGIYFILKLNEDAEQKNILYVILSSLFIGLALIIRTNEFLWIFSVLIFLLVVYHKKIKWQYAFLFLIINFLVFLPIFYYNQTTFGNYLSFGYLNLEESNNFISQLPSEFEISDSNLSSTFQNTPRSWLQHPAAKALDISNFVKFAVMPFGFHPGLIILNFYNYYLLLFWWIFFSMALGFFILLKDYQNKAKVVFISIFLIISLYLIIYYGSWRFADAITLKLNKIGISYVRYFLPIYILSLPFVAVFFSNFIDWIKNKKFKTLAVLFSIISFFYFTVNAVFLTGYDNLIKIKESINNYHQINQTISDLIESNAIIISQRSDKIFFPQHKVISGAFEDKETVKKYANLADYFPLYYYNFTLPPKDIEYLNTKRLKEFGLRIEKIKKINDDFTLYELKKAVESL